VILKRICIKKYKNIMNKKTMNNPKSDISIDSLKFAAL
jgi:hypothetical protein